MAQYGRPISDVSTGGWGTAPLWSKLDDNDDADFITSSKNPSSDTFENALTNTLSDPSSSSGHIIRARLYCDKASNGTATMYLYEGATLKATYAIPGNLATGFTTYSYTLSAAEADSITDYTNLRIRVAGSATANAYVFCSWTELEIPDAGAPTVTGSAVLSGNGLLKSSSLSSILSNPRLSGSGILNSQSLQISTSLANLLSTSTSVSYGFQVSLGNTNLSATSNLSAEGVKAHIADVVMSSSSIAIGSGYQESYGQINIFTLSDLDGDGELEVISAPSLSGLGNLVADGTVIGVVEIVYGTAYLLGNGELTSTPYQEIPGQVYTYTLSDLNGDGYLELYVYPSLSGNGNLVADGSVTTPSGVIYGETSLSGNGILFVDGYLTISADTLLTSLTDLDGDGYLEIVSQSSMIGNGNLSGIGNRAIFGSSYLSSLSNLVGRGNLIILSSSSLSGSSNLSLSDLVISINQANLYGNGIMVGSGNSVFYIVFGHVIIRDTNIR